MNRSIHLLLQTKSIFTIFISEIGINRDLAINSFERFGKLLTHELFIVLDYIVVLWVPWSFYPIYIYSQTASGFCSKTRITSKYFSTSSVTLLLCRFTVAGIVVYPLLFPFFSPICPPRHHSSTRFLAPRLFIARFIGRCFSLSLSRVDWKEEVVQRWSRTWSFSREYKYKVVS